MTATVFQNKSWNIFQNIRIYIKNVNIRISKDKSKYQIQIVKITFISCFTEFISKLNFHWATLLKLGYTC